MYLVLDLETSTKTSFGRKANPFDPDNYVVSTGLLYQDGRRIKTHKLDGDAVPTGNFLRGVTCIVGVNLPFDLMYLWSNPHLKQFFKDGGRIYDVQYARYLVTGQQHAWPSMNDMATAYGLPQKPDKIKAYWESGVDTIDIPKEELLEYLDHDLDTTLGIFKAVSQQAHRFGMVPVIREHMDGLCATIEMEYNGLYVDVAKAYENKAQLEKDIAAFDAELKQWEPELPEGLTFNWNSGAHISAMLFGGTLPYESKMPVLDEEGKPVYFQKDGLVPSINAHGLPIYDKDGNRKYRKGKVPDKTRPKTKNITMFWEVKGLTRPLPQWRTQKEGVYKTDEDVITTLAESGIEVCNIIAKRKKLVKDLTTYYEHNGKGMLTYVYPDHRIHHSLNNVTTVTGRLSSSKPNLQNVSRGDTSNAKEMFTSRFGADGLVAGADYSSLEVVIQAWLTKDPQMIQDVNDGLDFHCRKLAAKLGENYDDVVRKAKVDKIEEYKNGRTKAKEYSFQCLPTDITEVLTPLGWKPLANVLPGEEVIGFDVNSESLVVTPVTNTHLYPDAQVMIMDSVRFQFESTPNHRWYGKVRRGGRRRRLYYNEWFTTGDINSENLIRRAAPYAGGDSVVTPDEAALIAWLLTDGSTRWSPDTRRTSSSLGKRRGFFACIHQSNKKYVDVIRQLLDRLQVKYSELVHVQRPGAIQFYISSPDARDLWLRVGLPAEDKYQIDYLPWLCSLSAQSVQAFFDACFQAEGTQYGGSKVIPQNKGNIEEAIRLAGILCGYTATSGGYVLLKGGNYPHTIMNFSPKTFQGMQSTNIRESRVTEVGCLTTGTGTFIARQGNHITITGNSAYGAGNMAISLSTGMPIEEVKALAEADKILYPFVSKYAEWVRATVEKNAKPSGRYHEGTELLRGWHMSPTRKRYVFTQQPAPDFLHRKGIYYSFSPTEQKNYSVQGEAGAAVMSALGLIWRKFVATDNYGGKALLTNTVHDSVTFDLHKDILYTLAKDVEELMCCIPERYAEVYNIVVPVKFRIEFEYGPNLKDLTELKIPRQ